MDRNRAITRPIHRSISQSKLYSIISSHADTDVSSVSNSYGHIRIRYDLLRIERIHTEDLSAASVESVYANVAVL